MNSRLKVLRDSGFLVSDTVAQKNRKLRIQRIGKIGKFVLKNRRKTGKTIVLFSK